MSKTPHTPSPWAINSYRELPSDRSGKFIYAPRVHPFIAKIEFYGDYQTGLSHKENEANARLIAAAPEMLEALVGLVNCHTGASWQTAEVQPLAFCQL